MNTAKMSAFALRAIMGEAFDDDAYERGRQDARKFFREHPEERESKIEEVKQRLESGVYRHSPGPSYWIGCLCEADFTWMNVSVKIRSDIGFYIGDICYVLDDRLYIVMDAAGLHKDNWTNKAARDEYLAAWSMDLDAEAAAMEANFVK